VANVHWEVSGVDRWVEQMEAIVGSLQRGTLRVTRSSLTQIQEDAQNFLAAKTHPPLTRTPSLSGQPPALISGALRRSIKVRMTQNGAGGVYAGLVGPTIVYGRIQELGGEIHAKTGPFLTWLTVGGWVSKPMVVLPPRPFMLPAVELNRYAIRERFIAVWSIALQGGGQRVLE
jgi:phage gpG-like protein